MKKEHDLAKWLSGEMSARELQDFKNSPGFDSYQRIADHAARLETTAFNPDGMLQEIIQRPKAKAITIKSRKMPFFRMAAILVIALGSWFFFQMTQQVSQTASAGEKTSFALPDASRVVLNSDSKIQYKKWGWNNNRKLDLDGEAFFRVAKGKTFLVKTDLGNVAVVGTQFNVKCRESRFEVECFEGKVRVDFKNQTKFLSKGEIIVVDNGNPISSTPTHAQIPSWMQNQARMTSMALPAILLELERIYAVSIVSGPDMPTQKFTGYLPADDLETALEIIGKTYGFGYVISKNKVTLTAK